MGRETGFQPNSDLRFEPVQENQAENISDENTVSETETGEPNVEIFNTALELHNSIQKLDSEIYRTRRDLTYRPEVFSDPTIVPGKITEYEAQLAVDKLSLMAIKDEAYEQAKKYIDYLEKDIEAFHPKSSGYRQRRPRLERFSENFSNLRRMVNNLSEYNGEPPKNLKGNAGKNPYSNRADPLPRGQGYRRPIKEFSEEVSATADTLDAIPVNAPIFPQDTNEQSDQNSDPVPIFRIPQRTIGQKTSGIFKKVTGIFRKAA